ncbi:MAG TPA: xanthine dehydrogenase family protein molybdopterin-binding subunit [Acidimicrobiia bacterium]|nr:xanthine dehydrogenase family protein molybdopterin-binding subunit [Acidimicrobiia bacterium]
MTTIADRPPAVHHGATRVDGPDKVAGRARYAAEHPMAELAYACPVTSTVARGEIVKIATDRATATPGVLAVLHWGDVPHASGHEDPELALFRSPMVSYRGQIVAAVVATTLEVAQEVAAQIEVEYRVEPHDVELRSEHPGLYTPAHVNPDFDTDSFVGDVEEGLARSAITVDVTYTTPAQHNHPMEPHACTAWWDGDHLTVVDSTQGPWRGRAGIAGALGLDPGQVRVIAQHVGGGFGSKGTTRAHSVVAALAARAVDRPVRCVLARRQMPAVVGHRTPSIQRVRLGADPDGRLLAISHDVVEQTSRIKEFAEQTAVATRHMYAAPNRRTTHRLVRLDVPTPAWMRAPGECPGMFALESAIDELATELGIDPVELRIRNEPTVDPESGLPFSSRNLVACLRDGAARFGWDGRDPTPRHERRGRWWVGTGVAASVYPARAAPSRARITIDDHRRYTVEIDAADIGTGARTALLIAAAEALAAPTTDIEVRIGDTNFGEAMIAGGSMGTASWTWAIVEAADALRARIAAHDGRVPPEGLSAEAHTGASIEQLPDAARFTFGAQFAEARVDVDTGEVRVPRLLGVFAAGRIVSPVTARSQLVGGMTMGLSMALCEESRLDPEFGDFTRRDLASYHVAVNPDVGEVEAYWLDEDEPELGPLGAKGVGEVGIVGTAAAIANAVHHATGIRVRDLPITVDRFLDAP